MTTVSSLAKPTTTMYTPLMWTNVQKNGPNELVQHADQWTKTETYAPINSDSTTNKVYNGNIIGGKTYDLSHSSNSGTVCEGAICSQLGLTNLVQMAPSSERV